MRPSECATRQLGNVTFSRSAAYDANDHATGQSHAIGGSVFTLDEGVGGRADGKPRHCEKRLEAYRYHFGDAYD
jgi:hypothetical protein